MAFRRGGLEGILKAVACGQVCTTVFSSGLQVSGIFSNVDVHGLVYIQTEGPTTLSIDGKELPGHSSLTHPNGYASHVGKLKEYSIALEDISPGDLKNIGRSEEHTSELQSLTRISYAVFCLQNKQNQKIIKTTIYTRCT